jgi:tripartite-type tricarboxylate transporter receptor subunit TctC
VAESGYPGFDVTSWYGIVAPAKVPPAILDQLQADIAAVLQKESVRQKFAGLGVEPAGSNRADFTQAIQQETAKWAAIVKQAGIQPIQ